MEKLKVSEVVVVEGKYDAITLNNIIDGLIIPVNGFSIFKDEDKKLLLKNLGENFGIILVTDSDTAGFKIRNYIQNICKNAKIINVYIPSIIGKESRKSTASKEGTLGVEGINKQTLIKCFNDAGIGFIKVEKENNISYTDLFLLNLSGTDNATTNRKKVCDKLNIPYKLSKKAFLEVLNRMSNIKELQGILKEETALFWDFHGTLTHRDNQWVDAANLLVNEFYKEDNITPEIIDKYLHGKCLPWWTYPDRDTRHLKENDGWWRSCEEEFTKMFISCGLSKEKAEHLAPLIRKYVTNINNHRIFSDVKITLKTLKERGYKNYVLSNNFPELEKMIEELNLSEYFEGMVVSAKIGYAKPRKEIFDYAKNLAKDAKRYIMIGDSPRDDMTGAKKQGFDTIYLNTREREELFNDDMDYIINSVIEVLDILQ